mmetsp:Transcript_29989/g.48176  ORF Transcript_29989/g.48176 Transcript_29989/m.48176 type:complete len:354 (-) Transcript_29989:594-1655(-)
MDTGKSMPMITSPTLMIFLTELTSLPLGRGKPPPQSEKRPPRPPAAPPPRAQESGVPLQLVVAARPLETSSLPAAVGFPQHPQAPRPPSSRHHGLQHGPVVPHMSQPPGRQAIQVPHPAGVPLRVRTACLPVCSATGSPGSRRPKSTLPGPHWERPVAAAKAASAPAPRTAKPPRHTVAHQRARGFGQTPGPESPVWYPALRSRCITLLKSTPVRVQQPRNATMPVICEYMTLISVTPVLRCSTTQCSPRTLQGEQPPTKAQTIAWLSTTVPAARRLLCRASPSSLCPSLTSMEQGQRPRARLHPLQETQPEPLWGLAERPQGGALWAVAGPPLQLHLLQCRREDKRCRGLSL